MIKRIPWSEPFLDNLPEKIKSDVLLCSTVDITEKELNSGQPIILFEKRDGANISRRDLLKHNNVIRYVKQYSYRHFDLNNLPCVGGRFFTRFISLPKNWENVELIKLEHNKKITLGWNFLHYYRNQKFVSREPDWEQKRDIDVFFAGTTEYKNGEGGGGHYISNHRKTCVNAIRNAVNELEGISIRVADSRALKPAEYEDAIYRSKLVVSPWGWGEACYRDYEGFLAGCVVVKPRSDFVISSPDIFRGGYFVYCKPDWSDLKEKIEEGLKLSKNTDLLKLHRENILPFTGKEYLKNLVKKLCEY